MIKDNRRFDRIFGIVAMVEIQDIIVHNNVDYSIKTPYDTFIIYKISDKDYKRNNLTNKIITRLIKYGRAHKDNI